MKALQRETQVPMDEMDMIHSGGIPISSTAKAKDFAGTVSISKQTSSTDLA